LAPILLEAECIYRYVLINIDELERCLTVVALNGCQIQSPTMIHVELVMNKVALGQVF
jgi:hypothetical protein